MGGLWLRLLLLLVFVAAAPCAEAALGGRWIGPWGWAPARWWQRPAPSNTSQQAQALELELKQRDTIETLQSEIVVLKAQLLRSKAKMLYARREKAALISKHMTDVAELKSAFAASLEASEQRVRSQANEEQARAIQKLRAEHSADQEAQAENLRAEARVLAAASDSSTKMVDNLRQELKALRCKAAEDEQRAEMAVAALRQQLRNQGAHAQTKPMTESKGTNVPKRINRDKEEHAPAQVKKTHNQRSPPSSSARSSSAKKSRMKAKPRAPRRP